jgi:hypothetical protein
MRPEADLALRRLNALEGFFKSALRDEAVPARGRTNAGKGHRRKGRARIPAGLGEGHAPRRTLIEVSMVRVVSVLEAFVMDLGTEIVSERLLETDGSPELRRLANFLANTRWGEINKKGAWEAALEFWKDGIGTPSSIA